MVIRKLYKVFVCLSIIDQLHWLSYWISAENNRSDDA